MTRKLKRRSALRRSTETDSRRFSSGCGTMDIPGTTSLHYRRPDSITTGTSQEESGYYHGIVYEAIASQFTAGEEGREAKFFLNKLCSCLIHGPSSPALDHAVAMFQEALAKGHRWKTRLLLDGTSFFAKKTWGQALFKCASRMRRFFLRCRRGR